MDLSELRDLICSSFDGEESELDKILRIVDEDSSVFPFNKYEHLIFSLMNDGHLTFSKYAEIRELYIKSNPYLWIFEMSGPRKFGEKFAQNHVQEKCREIKKASKELDRKFNNAYDLWLDGIRIEVKASRAVDSASKDPLYIKALTEGTEKTFNMNFQQLKPQYCDVFVWVAVFRDRILIWVLNSTEVLNCSYYSRGQHRGNEGNEGQLHITDKNIHIFDKFKLKNNDLGEEIKNAMKRMNM